MFLREIGRVAVRLLVEDKVDVALAVQRDLLGAVAGDGLEPQGVKHRFQDARCRGGELDELETVEAHGVVEKVRHGVILANKTFRQYVQFLRILCPEIVYIC